MPSMSLQNFSSWKQILHPFEKVYGQFLASLVSVQAGIARLCSLLVQELLQLQTRQLLAPSS